MIDTIKFKIPIDNDIFSRIERKSIEFNKHDNEIDRTFIQILTKKIKVGSFDRHINIKVFDNEQVFLEFSAPKIFYGHNVFLVAPEQIIFICKTVHETLVKTFGKFPRPEFWEINRIDFCYAWKLPSEYVAEQVLNIFRGITVNRKKTHFYDTTVMYTGRTQSIKFYLKHPEFYEHDFKELKKEGKTDLAYNFLNISEGVLRFEVTLRNIALVREFYGQCKSTTIGLDNLIFTTKRCQLVLQKYLHKVLKLNNVRTMDNKSVFNKLKDCYGQSRARYLFLFYKLLFSTDRNEKDILKSYSRYQVWRNIKKLRECEVGISEDQMQVGFDFSIPSEYVVNNPLPTR